MIEAGQMTAGQATDFMGCIRKGEFVLMDGALGYIAMIMHSPASV
jgi:hypothetical protein